MAFELGMTGLGLGLGGFGTKGLGLGLDNNCFSLIHLIPLRPFKTVLDNVLLKHGGLPCVLLFPVHQIFAEQVEGVILSQGGGGPMRF